MQEILRHSFEKSILVTCINLSSVTSYLGEETFPFINLYGAIFHRGNYLTSLTAINYKTKIPCVRLCNAFDYAIQIPQRLAPLQLKHNSANTMFATQLAVYLVFAVLPKSSPVLSTLLCKLPLLLTCKYYANYPLSLQYSILGRIPYLYTSNYT